MNETIRKEQINWLTQSLKSGATFNANLNRSSKEGHAMSLIATHGQWHLTEEDLNEILGSNSRGIKSKIEGEYLYLWIPDYDLKVAQQSSHKVAHAELYINVHEQIALPAAR